ncbi:hypothetical protein BB559_003567 [Furculomyces boomerangus]|uniref:Vesicular-fusion protein SEC17 n=1 Tax=Furculomyces boomerangus TaxID=61424 RepID=A0A2T9YKS2_9FUNG|nr:hypothetical protein BB559_003567 [Furculomyces boomerangus]
MAESEARDLLSKANKKAEQKGWFGGRKYDEAAELYERAANQFKIAKLWDESGNAFMKVAEMRTKNNEIEDSAMSYIAASKSYKKQSPESSIDALKQAISILIQKGRFHSAANHQKEIAKMYETDLVDFESSMKAYETAAEWYSSEDSTALANGCLLKVATFAAQLEEYRKAIDIFETIAAGSIDNQLTKWSIKDYFLKAGMCYLAAKDTIGAQKAVDRYKDMDMSFGKTRECKLLENVIEDINNEDIDSFTNHVADFDRLTQLDSWKASLLLKAKNYISDQDDSLM